jgi:hypothetical protein
MLLPCEAFEVEVINPLVDEKDGGLKRGTITTVRAIWAEHHLDSQFFIYFLVWNPNRGRYMAELAAQFAPHDGWTPPPLPKIPSKKK